MGRLAKLGCAERSITARRQHGKSLQHSSAEHCTSEYQPIIVVDGNLEVQEGKHKTAIGNKQSAAVVHQPRSRQPGLPRELAMTWSGGVGVGGGKGGGAAPGLGAIRSPVSAGTAPASTPQSVPLEGPATARKQLHISCIGLSTE